MATLGWPASRQQALSMAKYPLNYVQCMRCSHIWNSDFDYSVIPYEDNPNRMYNNGAAWQAYINNVFKDLTVFLPKCPTVIDIGCGDGHFVRDFATITSKPGRFIGFDPNTSSQSGMGIEFYGKYFNPGTDILEYQPDLLIMRHVLEHLRDPAEFLDQLTLASQKVNKPVYFCRNPMR